MTLATIGLVRVDNPLEFGIVRTRDDGSIERFLEKPSWGQVFSDTINTGIFVLEPEVFDYIEPDRSVAIVRGLVGSDAAGELDFAFYIRGDQRRRIIRQRRKSA